MVITKGAPKKLKICDCIIQGAPKKLKIYDCIIQGAPKKLKIYDCIIQGAPEKLEDICDPASIPHDYHSKLKELTLQVNILL